MSTRFQRGQSGNPDGRPKGSKHKLSEAFLQDLQTAWESQGASVIQRVIDDRPQDFLKVVASILPRDLHIQTDPNDALTDEELIAKLRSLDEQIKPWLDVLHDEGEDGVKAALHPGETSH